MQFVVGVHQDAGSQDETLGSDMKLVGSGWAPSGPAPSVGGPRHRALLGTVGGVT